MAWRKEIGNIISSAPGTGGDHRRFRDHSRKILVLPASGSRVGQAFRPADTASGRAEELPHLSRPEAEALPTTVSSRGLKPAPGLPFSRVEAFPRSGARGGGRETRAK